MSLPSLRSLTMMRILTVAILIFFATQLLMLAAVWRGQKQDLGDFILPLPGRVASIVLLTEDAPPEERELLFSGMNASDIRVSIFDEFDPEEASSDAISVQAFREAIRNYSAEMNGRRIEGMVKQTPKLGSRRFQRTELGFQSDFPMRLLIELKTGEWLSIETPSILEVRIRNQPVGLLSGLFGLAIATLALISIWRQLRPVQDMAKAARNFAQTGRPEPVKPGGTRDIRDLVDAFNTLQTRVSTLMANRRLMMSAMSHDVRTYLTRLRLRIEMLDPTNRDAAEKTILDIEELLKDTLAFAEADQTDPDEDTSDICSLLTNLMTSGQFPSHVRWAGDNPCADKGLIIKGRDSRIQRVLVNLITNAVKYGGEAELTLTETSTQAILEIADRGPGIPDAEKDLVFEPFYRRDASRRRGTEGAGLGMAIAARLISRAGGSVSLSDRPGGGLIVRVTFQRAD